MSGAAAEASARYPHRCGSPPPGGLLGIRCFKMSAPPHTHPEEGVMGGGGGGGGVAEAGGSNLEG